MLLHENSTSCARQARNSPKSYSTMQLMSKLCFDSNCWSRGVAAAALALVLPGHCLPHPTCTPRHAIVLVQALEGGLRRLLFRCNPHSKQTLTYKHTTRLSMCPGVAARAAMGASTQHPSFPSTPAPPRQQVPNTRPHRMSSVLCNACETHTTAGICTVEQ